MKRKLLFTFLYICFVSFGAVSHTKDSLQVLNKKENNIYRIEPSKIESQKFTWNNIEKWYPTTNTIVKDRDKASSSFKVIEEHKSWVDSFSNEDIQELPVGVKYTKGNIQYAIGITHASIYKNYTELTVFARVRLPQTNENGIPIELFFGANNVKLSHEGGIIGDANLVLLGDMHIPLNSGKWMLTLNGGFDYKSGKTENKTYVTISCDGVKELAIEGEVEFSRSLILPVETNGKVNETKTEVTKKIETENGTLSVQVPYRVKGGFKIVASDWNDLLVGIDLQPFVLAKKRNQKNYDGNFQFHVNEAVLDFSDLRNDTKVVFPNSYQEKGLLLPSPETWRGVYINTIEVKLPKEFKTSETIGQDKRIGFGAHHLLLDNYGVSGSFYAENIFTIDKGRTNKKKSWAYSLDRIEITLDANRLKKASFNGKIQLPVSKNDKRVGLNYKGLISEEEYSLTVSNDSVVDFNLWRAKGELLPNSAIELKVKDGEFRPKAVLHGRLAVSASQKESLENEGQVVEDASGKKQLVEFKGIEFQNLVLKTEGTVFSVDYMGYKGQSLLGNFPVSISKIGITANETNANLYFDIGVNLMGENNGFAANTSLAIIGSFEERNYKQRWKFKELKLEAIYLKADMGGFSMEGSLKLMNNDPEYGDGFAASLKAKFKSLGNVQVQAKGVFGRKDFRYWQFEAMVDGLNIGTGLINLEGFSGGASYRMRRTDFSSSFSPSGIGYTPDGKVGLGVKAMVMFNAIKKEVIKGGAGFEIIFNRNGGVNFLGFYGQATFMDVKIPGMDKVSGLMDKLKANTAAKTKFLGVTDENVSNSWVGKNLLDKASGEFPQTPTDNMAISAKVSITYDFENKVLHGELDSFVNVAGGFVKGIGPGGRAGWAVLHFAPKEWYIYVGTPEDRLGLQIGVGSVRIKTGGYFMTGSKLLPSPPPPPLVAEIIKVDQKELDYMRDENALASGGGFAFGTSLSIDTGDLRFLIFYASFRAEAGFDIMLRDYGEAKCSNTGKQVGINGWYANGQAYAAMQGELGLRIKLFFIKKKIPIIKGAAAILLQAKAPNPIWMRGYMAGEFSVLGGLVKGGFRFKMSLGEECVFDNGAPLGGLKIISDVTPKNDATEIDVFAIPQATFSMKVGEPIVIPEDEGDKTYKIILEKYKVLHKGKEIPGKLEWSLHKDRANFVSTDILPPREKITVQVEVSFKEKINGIFRQIMVDGKPAVEIEERTFTTGEAPSNIPLHNITYAYPVLDQKYFLEDEHKKGYIQLKRGQDYLFDTTQWKSYLAYYDTEKLVDERNFSYNTADNILNYDLPNLSQKAKYHISIVSEPKKGNNSSSNTSNNSYDEANIDNTSEGNSVEIQKIKAQNLSKESGTIERLSYDFATSEYKTLKKKINAIRINDYRWGVVYSDVIYMNNMIKNHEPFDLIDLRGGPHTENKPLVTIEATLDDDYFTKDINPPFYAKYPMSGYRFKHRDENILGSPPKYALPIIESYLNNLQYDVNKNELETTFPFRYNLGLAYKEDWVDIHAQLVNAHIDGYINANDPVLKFLDEDYLFMRYGFYKTKLIYNLPGGKKGSEAIFKFKNPNKFR
ncbi:hypothetical protein [Tenacibaculum jejuense]|uniref:Uncharacterized protein n=1 Tax=Tenacibaculum jejuense TaxID=584609 RepID=A0A238U5S4_9FLAO|nr:hypothetical protein [Tenacibaculum jejuense]SNR14553.1 conserved exported protein of unknown function [Tenacibaculum jejuense]